MESSSECPTSFNTDPYARRRLPKSAVENAAVYKPRHHLGMDIFGGKRTAVSVRQDVDELLGFVFDDWNFSEPSELSLDSTSNGQIHRCPVTSQTSGPRLRHALELKHPSG